MRAIVRSFIAFVGVTFSLIASAQQYVTIPELELFPRPDVKTMRDYFPRWGETDSLAMADTTLVDEVEFDDWGLPVVTSYYRTLPDASIGMPIVFDQFMMLDSIPLAGPVRTGLLNPEKVYGWLDEINFSDRLLNGARQATVLYAPEHVKYNLAKLPEPPRHYKALVDPETSKIVLKEVEAPKVSASQAEGIAVEVDKRLWLRQFNASLQFSQAYISPNWYQGGKNNLNMLANVFYNVKLNEKFYKNIMFETTFQYKLGLNNAPDDTLRSYNISEDLLQINSKFGVRAVKRWYYTLTAAFKTQLLSSYRANTNDLKAAFLSPGELNFGIGMTYSYQNPRKTFTVNASISPLSWNMKTCTNSRINETSFGISPGHKAVHQFGSSGECNVAWKIAYNITYTSRLFAFTNYDYFQGDWEHTINFSINRYLSTQIYAHMRYDTSTKSTPDTKWHKFQFKEILSFGLSYSFK